MKTYMAIFFASRFSLEIGMEASSCMRNECVLERLDFRFMAFFLRRARLPSLAKVSAAGLSTVMVK